MKSLMRPELPTAPVGSSQATTAAVDNSAPFATRPQSIYLSGKVVQTNGATSDFAFGNVDTKIAGVRHNNVAGNDRSKPTG